MVSLFGAGSFLAQLSGGELTDRLGRRPVMLMSFFITPICMVVLGLARDLVLISLATLMVGSLQISIVLLSARRLRIWFRRNHGRAPMVITTGLSIWARRSLQSSRD
jgi:MFS family permease